MVAVPEAAVDENDFSAGRKNEIGFARQILSVQGISVSHSMHDAAE